MIDLGRLALWTVVVHTIVVTIHAGAHGALQILPATLDTLFILVVFFAAPITAALLLRARPIIARPLLFASMLVGLAYGAIYHYVLPTPDNVASLSPAGWGLVFIATTGVLAVLEGAGVAIGSVLLWKPRTVTPQP